MNYELLKERKKASATELRSAALVHHVTDYNPVTGEGSGKTGYCTFWRDADKSVIVVFLTEKHDDAGNYIAAGLFTYEGEMSNCSEAWDAAREAFKAVCNA